MRIVRAKVVRTCARDRWDTREHVLLAYTDVGIEMSEYRSIMFKDLAGPQIRIKFIHGLSDILKLEKCTKEMFNICNNIHCLYFVFRPSEASRSKVMQRYIYFTSACTEIQKVAHCYSRTLSSGIFCVKTTRADLSRLIFTLRCLVHVSTLLA